MRVLKHLLSAVLFFVSAVTLAQQKDSGLNTLILNVHGRCEQCKERIEKAAKGKGVQQADWSISSGQLTLVYDTTQTDSETIQHRLLEAGHDVESFKATDEAYNRLPSCCRYRTPDSTATDSLPPVKQLEGIQVISRKPSSYISSVDPIRTQVMTGSALQKDACCNIGESFETNPSVDVSYNDALTGSRQIQLLGLSGNYTQLTVENLPGPRGLATPLGLSSIPGPWVESIQLVKGTGSVANGYESIAGQINVELKKTENTDRLLANAYVNDMGKTDVNMVLSQRINQRWSTALLLHDDFFQNNRLDANHDGFRDLPTGNQFSIFNRWLYENEKGWMLQLGIKALNENRTGGQTDFNPDRDKFTTNAYGLGFHIQRYESFAKIGYLFPGKSYKSIGLQLSGIHHQQDDYFGLNPYKARQQTFYSNLIYQSIIGNTNHTFRTGLSFSDDGYNETFSTNHYQRTEAVPGGFFEYTYHYLSKLTVVAGLRADHNNLYGWFATPRLNIRYEPVKRTIIRLSVGRGQRTANIFAENASVFASARQVTIIGGTSGKAYGLDPEIAWNKGISIDHQFRLFNRTASFNVDFYRNDFSKQVVVDLEDPRQVKFYNLQGRSYSNSFQAELNVEPVKYLEARLAYRYYDVKETYDGKLLERPLIAAHRAFINLAYTAGRWKFDYTVSYNGKKRIPDTQSNPVPDQLPACSPAYIVMNTQITKIFGKKKQFEMYVGGENLTGYIQSNPIIAASQPFSPYFDASLIWGPVSGRMFYAGWRFRLGETSH